MTNEQLREKRLRNCAPNPRDNDIRFDQAQYIREMQEYLRRIEPDSEAALIPDGVFGPETTDAVIRFQRLVALEETGIIDYITWTQIVEAAADLPNE